MEAKGLRFNTNKEPMSMIMEGRSALTGLARVLEYGAKKYARANWRRGLKHTEIVDSLLRHLAAYVAGEDNDPESTLPHIDHVLCNAFFLAEIARTHPELDDRPKSIGDQFIARGRDYETGIRWELGDTRKTPIDRMGDN